MHVRALNWRRMMEKYRFRISLLVSFLIHFFTIVFFSVEIGKASAKAEPKSMEVTYQIEKIAQARQVFPQNPKIDKSVIKEESSSTHPKAEDFLSVKGKINDLSRLKTPFETSPTFDKAPMADLKSGEPTREIVVPSLVVEKMTNPKYARYKDNIRQKIKEKAYQYIQNPAFQSGEVYLTFILLANGTLKQFKVIDEKTRANEYLREISLKSIEESNPFPPFPADLNYPELTFSVPISFRIKQ